MVYYTEETPGVNKRMVAGYYLFLCLIGFAILLGPTGSGIPVTIFGDRVREAHQLATPDQENGVSCLTGECHNQTWEYWNMTTHSGYLIYYNETSGNVTVNGARERTYLAWNATCAQCHAIGWTAARNATDYPITHDGFGTNCLTCHDTTTPYYSVNGTVCATCHRSSGHGSVRGYTDSAHANSLTDLRASSHAGSDCMHCMSAEGFLDQEAELDPADEDYNAITCPACHSVHSADVVNPAQIRAVNSTELCGLCHVESRHPSYTVWRGGAHDLTGIVECTDCHGFEVGSHGPEMNHSFYVNAEDACGQAPECHEGQEEWAINQLEEIQSSFDALVADFDTEASAFETIVLAYNATAGADYELVDYVLGIVDEASTTVGYYVYDRSSGFHDPTETFDALNSAFRDLLDAKAYYYENLPAPAGFSADTLIIVGGAAGGILVGLLLGVLVGRRR
ncbi:MAG: ammonia-forming cytochrome c nitrite reductase subunit c552 [Candidatus Odinarchaeota archaeon]